jgi:hypothetical protein
MSKTQHSVKLIPYNAVELNRLSYGKGDVVFDDTNGTLRVMDGINQGGVQLLRADFANSPNGNGASVTISDTPPDTPSAGNLWFNSSNGCLYIYYTDRDGSQWIQPIAAPGIVTPQSSYTLPIATTAQLGGVIADGTSITILPNGTVSIVSTATYANSSFVGSTLLRKTADTVTVDNTITSTSNYNWTTDSSLFYENALTSNYTAAFVNMPTVNNKYYSVIILIDQGSSGYYPNQVSINGVVTYLNWKGGAGPVPSTNKRDMVNFGLLYTSGTWTAVGSYTNFKTLGS